MSDYAEQIPDHEKVCEIRTILSWLEGNEVNMYIACQR